MNIVWYDVKSEIPENKEKIYFMLSNGTIVTGIFENGRFHDFDWYSYLGVVKWAKPVLPD